MTTDPMSGEALGLLGSIVSANAASAAYTTNLLLDGKDEQIQSLAQALLDIERILDSATVIDRRTEQSLRSITHHFEHAEMLLSNGSA